MMANIHEYFELLSLILFPSEYFIETLHAAFLLAVSIYKYGVCINRTWNNGTVW